MTILHSISVPIILRIQVVINRLFLHLVDNPQLRELQFPGIPVMPQHGGCQPAVLPTSQELEEFDGVSSNHAPKHDPQNNQYNSQFYGYK